MKKLCYMLTIICLVTSNIWAAGSSAITTTVSEDVKHYNKGVQLMLDKKFSKADKQFRS